LCLTVERQRERIAVDILGYFLRNPAAMDNFEGIVRWRVMEEMVHRSMAVTEDVLNGLIADGYLRKELVPGGSTVYRLNQEMRDEAQRLVSGSCADESHKDGAQEEGNTV